MKLSKKSKQLIMFFTKNNNINKINQNTKSKNIITELYNDIYNAYTYLVSIKEKKNYCTIKTKKIENTSQIPRPQTFNSKSFPELVRDHINELTMTELTYQFSLYDRNVKLFFILEEENIESKIETYNKYVDAMIMWLHILNQYSSKQCSNTLNIYLYLTSLEKTLPKSNINVLDEINVNTAFTTSCPKDSEIVIFRKEEWFKVFIHETFHSFGLDFSDMNNIDYNKCILNIFQVESDVNLYESYTEFWAEIINLLFCSFFSLKDKTNVNDFLSTSEFLINFERTYSFFQLVKILNFMGLSYKDLYSKSETSNILRENLYKEKTNVLSYFVIKTILMNNYQGFLAWCKSNNLSLLQFKKTISNQKEFCKFIAKNYKTSTMIEGINETQLFLTNITKNNKTNSKPLNKIDNFILSNLRMSICELG